MKRYVINLLLLWVLIHSISLFISGCAQIGAPLGGARDSVAPRLIRSAPEKNKLNFNADKITFTFDEFIELSDLQNNLIISPLPKINPLINSNLKTITVKLKDSLEPNTTYNINFGNAIKDINEGNVVKNFNYTFSTGIVIDSFEIKGKIVLAENGKVDSSIIVLLYKDAPDSAVKNRKPNYITKLRGDGSFVFNNLPSADFSIYALKDEDGNKYYSTKSEIFGFYNDIVHSINHNDSVKILAYQEKKSEKIVPTPTKKSTEKTLKFNTNLRNGKQDLLEPLELSFGSVLKKVMLDSIVLTDTNYHPIAEAKLNLDSLRNKITISNKWSTEMMFCLIIPQGSLADSSGLELGKSDTIRFVSNKTSDYGSLKLSFIGLDLSKHPLLQFMEGDLVKWTFPVLSNEWTNTMMLPGEYEIRLLYDLNRNGKWDPGNYFLKLQPESAITLPQKISIKANWDNERDIQL